MLRSSVFVVSFLLFVVTASFAATNHNSSSGSLQAHTLVLETNKKKDNQNNALEKKLKKAFKPLIQLKESIVPHLPQKELNSMKRLAFRLLIIARRYL